MSNSSATMKLYCNLSPVPFTVGEQSGKAGRSVARLVPAGQANLEQLGARASTAASEISNTRRLH